jgi:hypothetical protein
MNFPTPSELNELVEPKQIEPAREVIEQIKTSLIREATKNPHNRSHVVHVHASNMRLMPTVVRLLEEYQWRVQYKELSYDSGDPRESPMIEVALMPIIHNPQRFE